MKRTLLHFQFRRISGIKEETTETQQATLLVSFDCFPAAAAANSVIRCRGEERERTSLGTGGRWWCEKSCRPSVGWMSNGFFIRNV